MRFLTPEPWYYYDTNDNPDDDTHDNIKSAIHYGTPGQTNQDGDYPHLNELKRIKVAKYDTLTVVSWALPDYHKDTMINGGIIPGMFTHNLGNSMKSIAKKWRQQQFNNRHTDIKEFCLKVFSDPDYDLSNVTKTLRNEGPGIKSCLGNQSTKNFNFFLNRIFDLRPDLAHLWGRSEDWWSVVSEHSASRMNFLF